MPAWVRALQPLLSGVFTVDNLDYVRRDAFFTGVRVGLDVERLRRYAYVSERGLTLYESGVAALEAFLKARLTLHQSVYFHRTVRAIDLDLDEVFRASIEAIYGTESPADRLSEYADLDEYALIHQAARWARGEAVLAAGERAEPGDGRVGPAIAEGWRGILLRRPRWRSEAEVRAVYEADAFPAALVASLGEPEPGRVAIDQAIVDARPAAEGTLAIEGRGGEPIPTRTALAGVPGFALVGRRYRRS
jgi:hypothetical protein